MIAKVRRAYIFSDIDLFRLRSLSASGFEAAGGMYARRPRLLVWMATSSILSRPYMQMRDPWRGKVGVVEQQQLPVLAIAHRAVVGARSNCHFARCKQRTQPCLPTQRSAHFRQNCVDMPPTKPGKKASTQKKEKLFHPQSRKAEQLMRVQQRKSKLADLAKARIDKERTQGEQHLKIGRAHV